MSTSWTRLICASCVNGYYLSNSVSPWLDEDEVHINTARVTAARPRAEAAEIISDAINRHMARKRRAPIVKALSAMLAYGAQALSAYLERTTP